MIRTAAQRALLRPLAHNKTLPSHVSQQLARFTSKPLGKQTSVFAKPLALQAYRPNTALIRSYASATSGTTRQPDKENAYRHETLAAAPGAVSASSTIHPVFSEVGSQSKEDETDMMAGIRHDVVCSTSDATLGSVYRG